MFHRPEKISIKQNRGHPQSFTNLYMMQKCLISVKSLSVSYCIGDTEILSARVSVFFFDLSLKERKQKDAGSH